MSTGGSNGKLLICMCVGTYISIWYVLALICPPNTPFATKTFRRRLFRVLLHVHRLRRWGVFQRLPARASPLPCYWLCFLSLMATPNAATAYMDYYRS